MKNFEAVYNQRLRKDLSNIQLFNFYLVPLSVSHWLDRSIGRYLVYATPSASIDDKSMDIQCIWYTWCCIQLVLHTPGTYRSLWYQPLTYFLFVLFSFVHQNSRSYQRKCHFVILNPGHRRAIYWKDKPTFFVEGKTKTFTLIDLWPSYIKYILYVS